MRQASHRSSKAASIPVPEPAPDGRKANAASTQAALRAAGRQLFGEMGYEATSLGAICTAAGVTTGALYHHFGDKKGLFAAVAEELDAGLVALTAQARAKALAGGADAWQAFLAAIDVFLQAGMNAEGRRIGLTMEQTVRTLQSLGLLPPGDVRLRARLILGLLYGAIEALAHQPQDAATALADARELVHAMLAGMRARSTARIEKE
jgi:AcrR family transcriptional regulator